MQSYFAQPLETATTNATPMGILYPDPSFPEQLYHCWLADFATSLQLAHVLSCRCQRKSNEELVALFMSAHDAAHDAALFGLSPLDCCWLTMLHLICSRCFRHFSELLLNSVRGLAIYNNIILLLLIN